MKAVLFFCMLAVGGRMLFAVDMEECFGLKHFMGAGIHEIDLKIAEYRQSGDSSPETYRLLATGILHTARASRTAGEESQKASGTALELTERVMHAEPGNDLALLYNGLAQFLAARSAGNPFAQWLEMNAAIPNLDKAVSLSKNGSREWYARLMRANCYACLPSMFGKDETVTEDYRFLFAYCRENPDCSSCLVGAYYYYGFFLSSRGKTDEAEACWEASVAQEEKSGTGADEARLSKQELAALKARLTK